MKNNENIENCVKNSSVQSLENFLEKLIDPVNILKEKLEKETLHYFDSGKNDYYQDLYEKQTTEILKSARITPNETVRQRYFDLINSIGLKEPSTHSSKIKKIMIDSNIKEEIKKIEDMYKKTEDKYNLLTKQKSEVKKENKF
jgi:hypothetical protein